MSLKTDTSKMDEQLASGPEFYDRLCLVRMSPSSAASSAAVAPSGEEVAFHGLWPALKFDSHRELMDQIQTLRGVSHLSKLRARMLLEYHHLMRAVPSDQRRTSYHGVAYLIGRGSFVLVPKSDATSGVDVDDENVFDFCRHCDEIERGNGHCGTEEFQRAFHMALHRMEESMEMEASEGARGDEGPEKEVNVTAIDSAGRTRSNAERSPRKKRKDEGRRAPPPIRGKLTSKVFDRMEYSPVRAAAGSRKVFDNMEFSPMRTTKETKKRAESTGQDITSLMDMEHESALPVKTVDFSGNTSSGSMMSCSPEKSSSRKGSCALSTNQSFYDDESQACCFSKAEGDEPSEEADEAEGDELADEADEVERSPTSSRRTRRSNRHTPTSSRDLPWPEMWDSMKSEGWSYCRGGGMVAYWYLHPTCAGMKKSQVTREKIEGVDYFVSEDDVKRYARVELGWTDGEVRAETPKDTDLAGRVKKRKRGSSKPPMERKKAKTMKVTKKSETKKSETKKTETKKTETKKTETKKTETKKTGTKKKETKSSETKSSEKKGEAKNAETKKAKAKKTSKMEPPKKTEKTKPKPAKQSARAAKHSPKRNDPDSPENGESEEGSRFSEGSSCMVLAQYASRKKHSPTLSEFEADLGVKCAKSRKKKRDSGKKLMFSQEAESSHGDASEASSGASGSRSSASGSRSSASGSASGGGTDSSSERDSSSGFDSPSELSSVDLTYQVLASRSAWDLLLNRFGFTYHQSGKYCLPGKENRPGNDSAAIEGRHYFATLDGLRKHLCVYGLPEIKPNQCLSEEEVVDLERWVRYAHVVGLRDAHLINPHDIGEPLDSRKAWTMLQKLGLRYTSARGYICPDTDPSKPEKNFERQQDLYKHLARFGIPRVEGFGEALSEEQRLALDLYFVDDTQVDTFKRIDPESEHVNEITPRRTRSRGGASAAEAASKPMSISLPDQRNFGPPKHKAKLNRRAYQTEFNELKARRTLPSKLLTFKEALSILVESYNFSVLQRDGEEYYCFPNIALVEGEDSVLGRDYFATIQDMRVNLCAFGLPPVAKGAGAGNAAIDALEHWARCAHVAALLDKEEAGANVPDFVQPHPKQARAWLKGLGYTFRDNFRMVLLPGSKVHQSEPGSECFTSLADLFNHIGRFGLEADGEESDASVSRKDRLALEVFAATVATFDVRKRIKCDVSIVKRPPVVRQPSAATANSTVMAPNTAEDAVPSAATKTGLVASTPIPPAMVVDEGDQDTPQPSPPKKPRTNPITNFFQSLDFTMKKATDAVVGALSPAKRSPVRRDAAPSSPASSLGNLSASCLDKKGDDELEACFADLKEQEASNAQSCTDKEGCNGASACFADLPEQDAIKLPERPLPNRETELVMPKNEAQMVSSMEQDSTLDKKLALKHLPEADGKGDGEVEACTASAQKEEASSPSQMDKKGHDESNARSSHLPEGSENESVVPNKDLSQDDMLKLDHLSQADSPNMPWKGLWSQMRKKGWTFHPGGGLVAFYYVHPIAARMKKGEMLKKCTEGVHYFTTEEDLKRYAMEYLGWSGTGTSLESPPSPSSDVSSTSRVKNRERAVPAMVKSNDAPSPLKRCRVLSSEMSVVGSSTQTQSLPSNNPNPPPRNEENKVVQSSSPGKKPKRMKNSSPQPDCKEDHWAPPDGERTVFDKLEACQMVLHPSFKKNKLSKSSSASVVSSKEDDIRDFMTKSIETGIVTDGMSSTSPGFLYICGGPGTGKTTAVTSCSDEMKKWARRNGYDKPRFCFINMAAISPNCKGGIMRAMLKEVASSLEIDKDANLSTFEKEYKKKVLVLILDEIDMLFKQCGGIAETWFATLVNWAENRDLKFSMIGISNCVNDASATRVRELGHFPRELVFSAYEEADILAILEQRLGKKVVDHRALQLISRRVAASSGDARRALEITSNAVGKCSELLSKEKRETVVQDGDGLLPLVKLPHMMRAIREGMPMRHGEVICGLPQAAKVILCIAVSLSQVWGPTAEISISQLKKYCVEATHHAIMDELGMGHIMNLVSMLVDSGLLVTENNGFFNAHDVNAKLKIGVQLDDVEIALEQSLLKEGGFYLSLVDYVKRECPRDGSA